MDVAARHAALREQARAYLRQRLPEVPLGRRLGPRLSGAAVLALGAASLGVGPVGPLELEILLDEPEWERLDRSGRPGELTWRDPERAAEVRVRGAGWLRARLAEPPDLWLRQRAVQVQDPSDLVGPALRAALAAFRDGCARAVERAYRSFRTGFEEADAAADALGRAVLLGGAVHAALALPVLARGEPYPPPRWLTWYLVQVEPAGEEVVALTARAAAGRTVDASALGRLRRLLEELLERSGYGERLVRGYGRLA